ncbi:MULTISPECIES: hypothetical protein [Niastella]|uniref:Uncharacterized protein n=1 Tax=Niastella soli TaxID=2821487 RepID=A0ABS3Z4Y4_9BACT|nr:hypothetical protein [Niastella soli]MBO9205230.1 hypothetical protein [Niastella soli]
MKVFAWLRPDLIVCYRSMLIACLLAISAGCYAQSGAEHPVKRRGDTLIFLNKGTCKGSYASLQDIGDFQEGAATTDKKLSPLQPVPHTPFLKIHGNVQYDFLYRSFIDTPFSQNDFQQHTIQTFLDITVKDKYPLKLNLSNRISNSFYFKNFMDVNLRFDRNEFLKKAKQELLNKIASRYYQKPDLAAAEAALKEAKDRYTQLSGLVNDRDEWARLMKEKEILYYKELAAAKRKSDTSSKDVNWPDLDKSRLYKLANGKVDSLADKVDSSYFKKFEQRKKELDSLQQRVQALQAKTDSVKNSIQKDVEGVRRKIYKAATIADLNNIESENEVASRKKEGLEKFLGNIKSIGIGRSVINYSELTAWNVSLTGFNLEYNDGIYAALAVGKIDYGFRDFMGKNTRRNGQNFLMGRIGVGDVDRKAVILSAFAGKRYNYGSIVADTANNFTNVVGYAIEGILKKDENTGISVELAKTTIPVSGSLRNNGGMKSLFQFAENANVGVSIKGQTLLPKTDTRISGFYRKTGAQFQSFSLYTINTSQTAWLFGVDQSFFNNKIGVVAALRRNDFSNPFAEKTFKSSTVFKSIQLNVRIPRWPSLSVGYNPGTQLYVIDKERIRENAYCILNASLVHNYKAGNIRMLSSLLYNKYFSKGTDSGFIAYKGINYMASQTLFLSKLQLQGMYMYADQEQMQYYTLDANADYALFNFLKVGAGIKYNKIMGGTTCIGNRAQVGVEVKKLGSLQLHYEKSYLPTIWQTLYPVETGRVSWFKYF